MATHLVLDSTGIIGGKRRPLSTTEIAEEVGIDARTVGRALAKAEEEGILILQRGTWRFPTSYDGSGKMHFVQKSSGCETGKGLTSENLHQDDHSLPLSPQTPLSLSLDEVKRESSKESSLEDSKDAKLVPKPVEIPETLDGKLKFILSRMPGLTEKVKDLDSTVARLIEVYSGDFSDEWLIEAAKAERRWVHSRQGQPVLTGKRDGNKTILNWFRMQAADARKDRKRLAGQELGRKARPEVDLDKYLHVEGGE